VNHWGTLIFFLLGVGATWLLIPLIIRWSQGTAAARGHSFHQTHTAAIPRFGGVALAVTFVCAVPLAHLIVGIPSDRLRDNMCMVGTALAMFALGFADDLRPLGARKKLLGQILISVVAAYTTSSIETFQNPLTTTVYHLGWWGKVITVLWLVAFTNLINLIDGIDGLAGGLALMLMALLAYLGTADGAILPVCCAAGMAGALVAFLRFNFPPAHIHLGDGGAYFLGYLIGIFAMRLSQKGAVATALVAPLFALALPIIDVGMAILRRGMKGLPLFRPDRKHLHHRLIGEGFSRRGAVLIMYGFSVVCLLMAFGVSWSQGRWVPIFLGLICLMVLLAASRLSFAREWFALWQLLGSALEVRKAAQYALVLCQWFELEAERSPSLDALWQDFEFMARKLGFSRVCLHVNGTQKVWLAEVQPPAERAQTCEVTLNHEEHKKIEFVADEAQLPGRVFDQLSELAAEAWIKGVTRWQATERARPASSS
jgi:UDP-GlcNAc:undecaprenyl-phosphate/decaprenyl-phosphate GlcNAc-1-phosphate transferase